MEDRKNQERRKSPSSKSVYLLHIMAGCNSTVSTETAKYLLDTNQCGVDDQEPDDLLTPLHVAASWDNLLMCQLLVHYGADLLVMNRDNYTAADLAKGKSQVFLRGLMKRGEKRRKRRILKFLRHIFQKHRSKSTTPIRRSVSMQCFPLFRQLSLNQQIEDYLLNAEQYNSRLSTTRFSGLFATDNVNRLATNALTDKMLAPKTDGHDNLKRSSSLSSYKTANDELAVEQRLSELSQNFLNNKNAELSELDAFPLSNTSSNLCSRKQMKKMSLELLETVEENSPKLAKSGHLPSPSAPPLTPNVSIRRLKPTSKLEIDAADQTPSHSASSQAVVCLKDVSTEASPSLESDFNENGQFEDLSLADLAAKTRVLTLHQLRTRLKRYMFEPGPIDETNRHLYERKLAHLELEAMRGVELEMNQKRLGLKFSTSLERLIKAEELSEELLIGIQEEELIQAEFKDPPKKDDITFFCYLLIDVSDLLPNPSFRDFLDAIFYIGKGKRSRPLQHFADTVKHRLNPKEEPFPKISRILSIWDQKMGVVSLHLFNNIHSAEALVREAAMIESMSRFDFEYVHVVLEVLFIKTGCFSSTFSIVNSLRCYKFEFSALNNLDNLQRGTFSGIAKSWSKQRQAEYGAFLLKKAYNIYQNERCRPIFEADVIDMRFR